MFRYFSISLRTLRSSVSTVLSEKLFEVVGVGDGVFIIFLNFFLVRFCVVDDEIVVLVKL